MLRSDRNIIMLQCLIPAGLFKPTNSQTPRGNIQMDSAHLGTYKADGQLVGTALGIPIYRKAALADGKYQYYDEAGNVIASN